MDRIGQSRITAERVFLTTAAMNIALCQRLVTVSKVAIEQRGNFSIALTGGRAVAGLYTLLRDQNLGWDGWRVYWGDERCLPAFDRERNSRLAMDTWLDHVPLPRQQIFPIPGELGAEAAARHYGELLSDVGDFDFVMLSLGEDGHVASVFPGVDPGGNIAVRAIHDAPKPPRQRVTLTLGRLARARELALLAVGPAKCAALAACRAGASTPGAMIAGLANTTVWCDSTAAGAGNGRVVGEHS